MAEEKEIILSVKTDTSEAISGVDELKSKLDGVNNTPVDKPFKTFKEEIKEAILDAKRLEEQFGRNSVEFANAGKRVAELKDRFGEFNASIAGFNPDNKLQALVATSQGAIGAIQGVTGAMTFLGVESDTAGVAIAKLQGLMAFSDALGRIDDIKNGFKNFGIVIQSTTFFQKANNAATVAATAIQRAFGASVVGTGTAFNVLKSAIVATGIGALIVGLGLLADKLGLLSDAAEDAADAQAKLNEELEKTKTNLREAMVNNDRYVSRQKEIRDNEESIKDLQARGASLKQINDLKRKNIDLSIQNLLVEKYTLQGKNKPDEDRKIEDQIYRLQQERNRLTIEEQKKAADKKKEQDEKDKAAREKKAKEDIERTKAGFDRLLKQYQDEEEATRTHYENENDLAAQAYEDKLAREEELKQRALDKASSGSTLADAGLVKAKRENAPEEDDSVNEAKIKIQAILEAQLNAENAAYQEKKLRAQNNAAELELIEQQHQTNLTQFKKEAADADKEIDAAAMQHKLETLQTVGNALGGVADLVGRQTVAGKALAVAQATISTIKGGVDAFMGFQSLGQPYGVILGAVAAAGVVASGYASIKKILSVPVPNKGSGGVSAPSPASLAPQINAASTLPQQIQNVRVTNNPQQQVVRAYITNNDLQSNQQKTNFLNNVSTF